MSLFFRSAVGTARRIIASAFRSGTLITGIVGLTVWARDSASCQANVCGSTLATYTHLDPMPAAAVALLVLLSVESYKATSRFYNKRKSRKHGYVNLPTDKLGRPINEHGQRLSKNEAKALAAHNQEIERIRTAEREWRAQGEQLPLYQQLNLEEAAVPRPNTAPAPIASTSHAVAPTSDVASDASANPARTRSLSAVTPSPNTEHQPTQSAMHPLQGGAFTVRRHTHTASPSQPIRSAADQPEIHDIFRHDGMDWRRATWEAPPIYREDAAVLANRQ